MNGIGMRGARLKATGVVPFAFVLLHGLGLVAPAAADLPAGGGVRGSSGIVLVDRLGAPFGGRAVTDEPLYALEVGLASISAVSTPVAWVSVSVLHEPGGEGGRVRLEWTITGDSDPVGFVVERGMSRDGSFIAVSPALLPHDARAFVDEAPPAAGPLWYRLVAIDRAGDAFVAGPFELVRTDAPPATTVRAPAPNPSPGAVALDVTLAAAEPVRLEVFDLQGRLVDRPIDGTLPAGWHRLQWNGAASGRPVAAGVYFLRVVIGARHDTFKVVVRR